MGLVNIRVEGCLVVSGVTVFVFLGAYKTQSSVQDSTPPGISCQDFNKTSRRPVSNIPSHYIKSSKSLQVFGILRVLDGRFLPLLSVYSCDEVSHTKGNGAPLRQYVDLIPRSRSWIGKEVLLGRVTID